ncbi:transposase [Pseudoduganella sp. RAF53_2]|uniref:transposase n=1 Tax=unclassified Pseudoduganella TaxID=2637179 RepID=UPI003F96DEA4
MPTNLSYENKFRSGHFPRLARQYRQHSLEFKLALVVLALQPGASGARIAREHNLNANLLFCWRKLYRAGCLGPAPEPAAALLPAVMTGGPAACLA